MIEIGPMLRIENGPARKTARATRKLMDNRRTASHYQFGARDSRGKRIRWLRKMEYLDYLGPWVWYVYKLDTETGRWLPAGFCEDKASALAAAEKLKE